MKVKLTYLLFVFFFTQNLKAQDTKNQIIKEAIKLFNQDLDVMDISSCLNLSRSDYEAQFKSSLESFFKEEGINEYIKEELEYQGAEAIASLAAEASDFAQYNLIEKLRINEDDFYACQEKLVQQMYENGDFENDGMEELDQYLQSMGVTISASEVGLPVYENSTLITYMNEEQSEQLLTGMFPDIKGPFLNSVIYHSNGDFDDIVSFYARELSGFKKGNIGENSIGFTAQDYDFNGFLTMEGIKKWAVLESVWVEKMQSSDAEKVKIEIHWK